MVVHSLGGGMLYASKNDEDLDPTQPYVPQACPAFALLNCIHTEGPLSIKPPARRHRCPPGCRHLYVNTPFAWGHHLLVGRVVGLRLVTCQSACAHGHSAAV